MASAGERRQGKETQEGGSRRGKKRRAEWMREEVQIRNQFDPMPNFSTFCTFWVFTLQAMSL